MGRAIPACLVLAACCGRVAAAEPPQQREPLDGGRVKTRLYTARVRFEPTRAEPAGQCLGMRVEDLRVEIGRRPVADPTLMELHRERQPTLHALLIDTSGSMIGKLAAVRQAAAGYVATLEPEREQALVVTFDDAVRLIQSPTSDRGLLREALNGVRMGQMTALHDGLCDTLRELATHRERPVLVLLTDGVDTASLHDRDDVRALARSRPDLAVFVIGLSLPGIATAGPDGLLSTRKFLEQLARQTHGELFTVYSGSRLDAIYRRIREILDSEATLSVIDPDPDRSPASLSVTSRRVGCRVEVLKDSDVPSAEARPGSIYSTPPLRSHKRRADPECAGYAGDTWWAHALPGRIEGCLLDVTRDWGALYAPYAPGASAWAIVNKWPQLEVRPFSIPVPAFEALPPGPEWLLDALAEPARFVEDGEEAARPFDRVGLSQGRLFFDVRARLGTALLAYPDYRQWALDRLRHDAEQGLEEVERTFRRGASAFAEEDLRLAARESPQGRRLLKGAANPSDADLAGYLAAWLGDVAASALFVRWEALHANRLLAGSAGGVTDDFVESWRALRRIFFVPSYGNVLTLLAPVHDPTSGRVGFWRVALPRLAWLEERAKGLVHHPEFSDLPLDLVPDVPFGYWLVERMLSGEPELAARLRAGAYRVESIHYALRGKSYRQDPLRAFRETRVTVSLLGPASTTARLVLDADVDLTQESKKGERFPTVESFEVRAPGDPALEDGVRSHISTSKP